MHLFKNGSTVKWRVILIMLILLAFWPLASYLYIPKWDNIDCYLPYRYFVSYAAHQGEWPFWSPFQHMGYPAYSDMQNGMYSPIVWFLNLFGQYNTTSLITEMLIYYVFGILGAYKFSGLFVEKEYSKVFVAIAFGLSGFMLGTSQIMIFIAGGAFLPHMLYHFIRFLKSHEWKDITLLVLFIALHTTSASPAYSIVLIYVLIAVFGYHMFRANKSERVSFFKGNTLKIFVMLAILLGVLLPYMNALLEFLPYFNRGTKLPYSDFLLENPFDHQEYITFLFPYTSLSGAELFGNTDMTMRSAYIGIIPLIFGLVSLRYFREQKIKLLWFGVLLFLILSAGGMTPFYRFFYELPGFGLFRHPALFRVYVILFMAVLAGIALERWDPTIQVKRNKLFILVIIGLMATLALTAFVFRYPEELSDFRRVFMPSEPFKNYSLRTFLFVNALVLMILGLISYVGFSRVRDIKKLVLIITVIDLLVYSQITSNYTVHYPERNKDYVTYFKQLPAEIDQSCGTVPYKELPENYQPTITGLWRNTATFHKKLTFDGHNQTQFSNFNVVEKNGGLRVALENPLFYEVSKRILLKDTTTPVSNALWQYEGAIEPVINPEVTTIRNSKIAINEFSAQIENTSSRPDIVIVNQNYHHLWKAFLDGKEVPVVRVNDAFMGIEIPAGTAAVLKLKFDSPNTKVAVVIALFFYAVLLFLLGRIAWSERKKTVVNS
jgi:hypothetical protein